MNKHIIGKTDRADFPKFGLENVKVKIDSGAYTSSIHCDDIIEKDDGLSVVFLHENEEGFTGKTIYFDEYETKKVRSSSGQSQIRYKVKGNISLFGETFNTEFTLSIRDRMKYPVLLGRKLLNKQFLIDTSKKNLSIKLKHKNS